VGGTDPVSHSLNVEFRISAADGALYCRSIGTTHGHVPPGFVMRVLVQEPVSSWLKTIAGEKVPVHLRQSHETFSFLLVESTYHASIVCWVQDANDMELEITVRNSAGELHLAVQSRLKLVSGGILP
jgi:hypothetical protein